MRGVRDSKTFRTKREAEAWAAARDAELRAVATQSPGIRHSLADALIRYVAEVSPTMRGERWECARVGAFLKDANFPTGKIGEITPEMIGRWRDTRLRQVTAGTVIREMSLLAAVMEHARREWRWIHTNPCRDVRRPRTPDHREVVISPRQIRLMLESMGYLPGKPCRSVPQAAGAAFVLALRTGMRAGEITGLTWDRVRADSCWLPVTKTTPREVPLSRKARNVIEAMRGWDDELEIGRASCRERV